MRGAYDVVIAGGGVAGAALAARLSEDENVRVLLLEAGPDLRPDMAPPALRSPNAFRAMAANVLPLYTWPGLSARRTPAQEPLPYLRGRGLGGSSAMNGTIATQPFPEDFAAWAAAGCAAWSWDDVLPHRIALEDDLDFGERPYHGRGGPVPISRPRLEGWGAVGLALREAATAQGHPWQDDLNDPSGTGVSPFAHACRDGRRVSVSDAYLEPARARPNLTIACEVLVDSVLIEGGAATGVAVVSADGGETHHHGDQVVVCGGPVGTPGILVRSGIGPEEQLTALGIAAVADLPVGSTYLDHCGAGFTIVLKEEHRNRDPEARPMTCALRYSSGLAGGGRNDMNAFALDASAAGEAGVATGFVKVSVYETFSSGRVSVVSRDPRAHPRIEMNLLSDERDLVRLRDGIRRLVDILRAPAFTAIATELDSVTSDVLDHDDRLDDWLRSAATDTAHGVGTCPMGKVVDEECRVLGVEGLRVVDASVMPAVPRVNTMLPALIVAEVMAARMRSLEPAARVPVP